MSAPSFAGQRSSSFSSSGVCGKESSPCRHRQIRPSISRQWNLRNYRRAGKSRKITFHLPKTGGTSTIPRHGEIQNCRWKMGKSWSSTQNRSPPKKSRYSRLADCRWVWIKKSNRIASQKRLLDSRGSNQGRMTGNRMRSQPILTFHPKIRNGLTMNEVKIEFHTLPSPAPHPTRGPQAALSFSL